MSKGNFIPPVPKEYITYSEREKIEKTEEYYQKVEKLYQRIDNSKQGYLVRADQLLKNGATVKTLFALLQEKEAQVLCHYTYEFYLLKFLCNIAETEENFSECSVLQNINNMEDVLMWHQKSVFLLRRFEMDWEENDELRILIETKRVSYIYLVELICEEWIIRKIHTGSRIAWYLFENGLKREALLLLMRLEQRLPYSERKVMIFAMTLLDMGERRLAYDTLMKYQNPGEDIRELQNALREML